MQHDGVAADALRTIELVDHGGNRLRVEERVGGGEVDQIGGVCEDRPDGSQRCEERHVVLRHLLPLPLIRVLREEGDGGCVDRGRALEDGVQATLRGDVRADQVAGRVREGKTGRYFGHGRAITRRGCALISRGNATRCPPTVKSNRQRAC